MKTTGHIRIAAMTAMLLALGGATQVLAQEPIDETRKANADVKVKILNLNGSVTVEGWDREEVKITGTLGRGTEGLDIDGSERQLRIEVVIPERARNVKESYLEIRMPAKGSVEVSVVNADVEVSAIEGEVYVDAVNGDLSVTGKPAEVEANTVNGEIDLELDTEEVRANTVNGDLRITKARGALNVETVSGDITIGGGPYERIGANTISGDIELRCDISKRGSLRLESHSGTIDLLVPESLDADFEISTFSGDIDSDVGGRPRRTSKFTPGLELDFTMGSGDAEVRIETFSGDVDIRTR